MRYLSLDVKGVAMFAASVTMAVVVASTAAFIHGGAISMIRKQIVELK